MRLDADLSTVPTTHLLNIWLVIMTPGLRKPREYLDATDAERAAFYQRLGDEIDARIPPRSK
jgi:hypothetical protein